ncbi:MAG: response regulator [bacterium]|nr:response regulator [bacterium]
MGNRIVLCIDDEDTVLSSLEMELGGHQDGYQVEVAQSGEDALELAQALVEEGHELALVVADYIMPGMKGDEVLIALHKQYPQAVKILLTGQAQLEGVTKAINEARLYRYMAKPWEKEDLRLTVQQGVEKFKLDHKLAEQEQLIQRLNESLADGTGEEATADPNKALENRLSEQGQFEVLLFGRFFRSLSIEQKEWVGRATIGLICTDKKVTKGEMAFVEVIVKDDLRKEVAGKWVDMVKAQEVPVLDNLNTSPDLRFEIMLQLSKLFIAQHQIRPDEERYYYQAGKRLGLDETVIIEFIKDTKLMIQKLFNERKIRNLITQKKS